jgi:tRNA(Arg) A34 adenosine deaminase TadA
MNNRANRRAIIAAASGAAAWLIAPRTVLGMSGQDAHFVAEAARMRQQAIASGDQPYGAVLVSAGEIVGYGASRVVVDGSADAHAERVALWDTQQRMGRRRLDGTIIYSTSRPCALCQRALAQAGVARMRFGPEASDGGPPQKG